MFFLFFKSVVEREKKTKENHRNAAFCFVHSDVANVLFTVFSLSFFYQTLKSILNEQIFLSKA